MTSLSKTDLTNLEAMIDNGGTYPGADYKGTMYSFKTKLIQTGLVEEHVWGGTYVYQITANGRAAYRAA